MKIAIANSRTEITWQNVDWSEEKLLAKLRSPVRTPETLSAFMEMSKSQQGELNTPPAKAGGFTVATKVAFRLKPVWPLLKQAEVIPPQFGRFHLHLPVA